MAGPPAPRGVPSAPRGQASDAAAFVALPDLPGLYLEVLPERPDQRADELAPRLLPVVQAMLEADRSVTSLTGELAARYEEIDLLYSIGEFLVHGRSVSEVAQTILREVADVTGARRAGLRVYDEARGVLQSVAILGPDDGRIPAAVPVDAPDDVVIARAFRSRRIEAGRQPDWVEGELLAVPITYAASGQVPRAIGMLALADRAGGGMFTREETKLVAAVATQIGAALENARLVAQEAESLRLARELELAHDLQVKLMPTPAVLQGDAEVAVHMRPAESLGGDFYTFSRLGRHRIGVMIGDVSSHGFSAALIAAQVMAAAGIHANAATPPDETLAEIRASLADELANTEMYLSLFYGMLDPTAGRLTFSNAGHPHAFRVPRFGLVERLAPTAPPLGIVEAAPFGRTVLPWRFTQDLLVLCTDGLTDALGHDGTRYGEARLLQRLSEGRHLSPEGLMRLVLDDLAAFSADPHDDITLLVLRA